MSFRPKLQTIQTKTSLTAPDLAWSFRHEYEARLDLSAKNNKNGSNIMGLRYSPSDTVAAGIQTNPGIAHAPRVPFGGNLSRVTKYGFISSAFLPDPFPILTAVR